MPAREYSGEAIPGVEHKAAAESVRSRTGRGQGEEMLRNRRGTEAATELVDDDASLWTLEALSLPAAFLEENYSCHPVAMAKIGGACQSAAPCDETS